MNELPDGYQYYLVPAYLKVPAASPADALALAVGDEAWMQEAMDLSTKQTQHPELLPTVAVSHDIDRVIALADLPDPEQLPMWSGAEHG